MNGDRVFLSPERSMQVQRNLGADIVMAFDECTAHPSTHDQARESMELSSRWAMRSRRRAWRQRRRVVRHRAGRHVFGSAARIARAPHRNRFRRLRGRRAVGRRIEGRDGRGARRPDAADARRSAALSDGRRHAGRSGCCGRARRRHVRLRDADAQRAQRLSVHVARRVEDPQRAASGFRRDRSTPSAAVIRVAVLRARICIISIAAAKFSAAC